MDKKVKGYTKHVDYMNDLQKRFPEFSMEDLNIIVKYGSRNLYHLISRNADVMLLGKIDNINFKLLFGRITFQSITHKVRYALKKVSIKFKLLFKRRKLKWDGYYYFGLTSEQFKSYQSQMSPWFKDEGKKRKRYKNTEFTYGDIVLYKLYEECKLNMKNSHFFRVPSMIEMGFKKLKYEYKSKKAEYIAKRTIDGYDNMIYEYKSDKLSKF